MNHFIWISSLSFLVWSFEAGATLLSRNKSFIENNLIMNVAAMGDYKRQTVPREYDKLKNGIGSVVDNQGRFSTAFCVSSNIIATASHVLEGQAPGRSLGRLKFQISGKNGGSSQIEGKTAQELRSNTFVGSTRNRFTGKVKRGAISNQTHYDWGLARLKNPICEGRELKLQNAPLQTLYNNENKIISIFYQRIKGRKRLQYSLCKIDSSIGIRNWRQVSRSAPFPEDIFLHNCDIKPGGSGAPIIWISEDGPKVVGIHTSSIFPRGHKKPAAHRATHIRSVLPYLEILRRQQKYPSKELTRRIQQFLKNTGDYKSGIDGNYGKGTRQAIIDFTIRHSLPVMFDRPVEELLPIMEKHQSLAPFPKMLKPFEVYLYHPSHRRHKAVAVNFDRKISELNSGSNDLEDAKNLVLKQCAAKINSPKSPVSPKDQCKLYAINDAIIYQKDVADRSIAIRNSNDYFKTENYFFRSDLLYYKNKKGVDYKAAAVDLETGELYSCENQPSLEKATSCAIETCETQDAQCQIFALGNKVIFKLDEDEVDLYRSYYKAVLDWSRE